MTKKGKDGVRKSQSLNTGGILLKRQKHLPPSDLEEKERGEGEMDRAEQRIKKLRGRRYLKLRLQGRTHDGGSRSTNIDLAWGKRGLVSRKRTAEFARQFSKIKGGQ